MLHFYFVFQSPTQWFWKNISMKLGEKLPDANLRWICLVYRAVFKTGNSERLLSDSMDNLTEKSLCDSSQGTESLSRVMLPNNQVIHSSHLPYRLPVIFSPGAQGYLYLYSVWNTSLSYLVLDVFSQSNMKLWVYVLNQTWIRLVVYVNAWCKYLFISWQVSMSLLTMHRNMC